MSLEMKVPPVGESITEVTIASWSKSDGDFVEMDEILCELESDKATFELPAEDFVPADDDVLVTGCLEVDLLGGGLAAVVVFAAEDFVVLLFGGAFFRYSFCPG